MRLQISCISRKGVDIISSRFSIEELKDIFLLKGELGFTDELSLSVEEDELFKPETDWKIRDPELSRYWSDKLNFWKANHVFVGASQIEVESVMRNNPADYYYFKDCDGINLNNYKNAMIYSIVDCNIKDIDAARIVSIRGNTKIEKNWYDVNIRAISENTEIKRIDGNGDIEVICGNAKIRRSQEKY